MSTTSSYGIFGSIPPVHSGVSKSLQDVRVAGPENTFTKTRLHKIVFVEVEKSYEIIRLLKG